MVRSEMLRRLYDVGDLNHGWLAVSAVAQLPVGIYLVAERHPLVLALAAALASKYLREAAPAIQPLAVEVPVSGTISGVAVRCIVDPWMPTAASST